MELDELKKAWQAQPTPAPVNAQVLRASLTSQAIGVVERLRRQVRKEMWLGLLLWFAMVGGYYLMGFALDPFLPTLSIVLLVAWLPMYWGLLRSTRYIVKLEGDVLAQLKVTYTRVKLYRRYQLWATTALTLLSTLTGALVSLWVDGRIVQIPPQGWALILGVSLVLATGAYFYMRWYLHKHYKKYLIGLEAVIGDLSQEV